MTAPGISGAPPTTSTDPRASLSPSPSGFGSGQRRSTRGVIATGRPSVPLADLRRDGPGIRLRRDLFARFLQRSDRVVLPQDKLALLALSPIEFVPRHRAVRHFVPTIDLK